MAGTVLLSPDRFSRHSREAAEYRAERALDAVLVATWAQGRLRTAQERLKENQAARLARIIGQKLNTGRLPQTSVPRIYGAPGVGGVCDACDKSLAPTQLVMSVPWPSRRTFAHLHADCFMAWNEVRCSRTPQN